MKINYKNPTTGKSSTVVLADHWVKVYLAVMAGSWDDYDLPIHKRQAIVHMIEFCVNKYFSPIGNCPFSHEFVVSPSDCTFTTFVENFMASQIYHRAALPFEIQHSNAKTSLSHPELSFEA